MTPRRISRHSAALGTAAWIAWQFLADPSVTLVLLGLSPLVLIPLVLSAALDEAEGSRRLVGLSWAQLPCALALVFGLWLAPGWPAAVACVPWAAWTAVSAFEGLVRVRGLLARGGLRGLVAAGSDGGGELAVAAGLGFPLVGSAWLLADRLELMPLGFSPLFVILTAIHFHHAGFTLPMTAGLLARSSTPGPWSRVGALVVVAVPLTAIGITASPLLEWIGAWMTAAAGIAAGVGLLLRARTLAMLPALLSAGSGACLLAGMVFAGAYALGEYFGVAFPDIASMIQLHGAVNALGFGLLGAWAWHLSPPPGPSPTPTPTPAPTSESTDA